MNYTTRIYKYVSEIPQTVWNNLEEESNSYFSKPYLIALESNNSNSLQFFYVIILKNNNAIAIATLHVLEFDFIKYDFTNNTNKLIQKISYHLSCLLQRNYVKIMLLGNSFLSGEHGLFVKKNEDHKEVLICIANAIQTILNANSYLKKWVDIILLKDFKNTSTINQLKNNNFAPVQIDANMVLEIKENWNTFEDYLSDFKSKFRIKAKKAYTQSNLLTLKSFTSEDILIHKNALTILYLNVVEKAKFNWAILNISTYATLQKEYPEKFIFNAYYLNDEIVGFSSGFIISDRLDAHYIGIDYSKNKQHAIYSRMLYDYVKIAIKNQVKQVSFGRTAGEIKSSLGATPQILTTYVRHKKSVANFIFKPFLKKIKPVNFKQHNPFKKITI